MVAGSHLKKVVLELGGSDAFIVMPSADLEQAARVAVRARTANNGQSCIAGKRFIVHGDIYEEFLSLFTRLMTELKVGDPLNQETEVGPLATESVLQDLSDLVEDARKCGAKILTGGYRLEGEGWFYSPTVISEIPHSARIRGEEAFGPVASVYRAESAEDALRIANQTDFGLSSAVWSKDTSEQDWFIAKLEAGAVFINGMTTSYPELPFGGIKNSGIGRELSAIGIQEFCNLKTVWKA